MPFKKIFSIICGVCISLSHAGAQTPSHSFTMSVFTSASLLYDVPQSFGAQIGVDFPLNSRHIFISKKGNQKERFREMITSTNFGFYRYAFNNTGLFFQHSIGFRYHKLKPYYFECLLSVGVLRTFYDGLVYTVNNEGVVNTLPAFGRWYAITGITTGFGWDFQRSAKPTPFAVSVKPALWIQYPYNSFILPHVSVQLSMQYHIPSFNVSVHQKEIKRGPHI